MEILFNIMEGVKMSSVGEFQINSYTDNDQEYSVITNLIDGGFVVVWVSNGQDGSSLGIYGQRYNASGIIVGDEFQVNTDTNSEQDLPSIASLEDGGFVVTWQSLGQYGASYGIYGQRYAADGTALGGEFQINTYTNDSQSTSSVTGLSDGSFVVTWTSLGQDGAFGGIYGQRYAANGSALGGEFQVNTYTTNHQERSSIASLAGGGFVVTWSSNEQDGSRYGVYGQRYDINGNAVGNEFQVNTYTENLQGYSSVAGLIDGGFVVVWDSFEQNGSSESVYGQRYDANWNAIGSEFQVNTYIASNQYNASIEGLIDGGFVITWETDGQDGSSGGVYGQRYDAGGSALGGEFQVNTFTLNDQINSSITRLLDGGFVVTWESDNQDGSNTGIYGQRYDANGNTVVDAVLYEGSSLGDILEGGLDADQIFGLGGNDFLEGKEGDDYLDGGAGIDTATYTGRYTNYTVQITSIVDNITTDGLDTLVNIERLEFLDINVALDLGGNCGITAKIIGATFDAESLDNADFVGEVLAQVDAGSNYESLMVKYIEQAGAYANEEVVDLLFENLVGRLPNETQSDRFIGFLESGKHTIGSLGVLAAEHRLNDINIDFVGLSQTGLEYTLA